MRPLLIVLTFYFLPLLSYPHNLVELENRVKEDVEWIQYPADWLSPQPDTFDVVIVGGGMAGLSSAFALKKLGIHHLLIVDQNPKGCEGPWTTYGLMKKLITSKYATGPGLNFPSLSFQAWYEASFGQEAWSLITVATPLEWKNYLDWFRDTLKLPVAHEKKLIRIEPLASDLFMLEFDHKGTREYLHARKVVLATGRLGGGGARRPDWTHELPQGTFTHSTEMFPHKKVKGRTVAVIGCGASALDIALTALQEGALRVDLLYKRKEIPSCNLFEDFAHPGFEQGYFQLGDSVKCKLISKALEAGTPPSQESLQRASHFNSFALCPSTVILGAEWRENSIFLHTTNGSHPYDHVFLATGFEINLGLLTELHPFSHLIQRWDDLYPELSNAPLGCFPYLDAGYRFNSKIEKEGTFLKNIHCFNYAALLSHGLNSSSIDALSAGSERLAREIASDFLKESLPQISH